MTHSRLYIICGLPGAGKTTRAKEIERKAAAVRFCPDEWMSAFSIDLYNEDTRAKIEAFQWEMAKGILLKGIPVIIEWGTWARSERDALREWAQENGIPAELHYLKANMDVLCARIQERGKEDPPLSWKKMQECAGLFQEPTEDEIALFDTFVLEVG